ncbi:MAG: putative ABC transporter permease, partial [Oscillospiraceae bacterium]|nr:putative ABC transporter permease [Oscillospiraceae bacterium]
MGSSVMELMIPEKIICYLLFFSAMSFVGWVIEVIYRSLVEEKRLVNPGFLSGPFLPIYGFGSVIITLVSEEAETLPPVLGWAIILLSPTVLEYFGSWVLEKIFKMKLWDYHENFLNLNGRICLKFSFYWASGAAIFILLLEPALLRRIALIGPYLSHFLVGGLFAYFIVDIQHSVTAIYNFKDFQTSIAKLIEKGKTFQPALEFLEINGKKSKLPI